VNYIGFTWLRQSLFLGGKNMNEKTICPKCGAELDYTPDEGPFCEQCGARLIQDASQDAGN
jgi:predicted amidophosphoribosyltransferase